MEWGWMCNISTPTPKLIIESKISEAKVWVTKMYLMSNVCQLYMWDLVLEMSRGGWVSGWVLFGNWHPSY